MYDHRDDIGPEPPEQRPPPHPERLQRVLIWGLAGAVAVALIAFLAGVVLDNPSDDVKTSSAAPSTTTTTEAAPLPGITTPTQTAPPTTAAKGVVNPITGTPQLAAAPTTTTKPGPTTTADPCRNSHDPQCGPFRWDPPPGPNDPLKAEAKPESQQASAGSTVKFSLMASDPDSKIDKTCIVIDWDDGHTETTGPCPPPAACPGSYGPWAPPARVADHDEREVTHVYTAPNTPDKPSYLPRFRYQSQPSCDPNPYGGVATANATVTVTPAP